MDDFDIIKRIVPLITALLFAMLIGGCINTCVSYNERIDNNEDIIDSIKIVNKDYKNKLNKLDSIKDAEIIEVKKLDNDSTVKLFYRLIRE
jgi:hypothetical protein